MYTSFGGVSVLLKLEAIFGDSVQLTAVVKNQQKVTVERSLMIRVSKSGS